MNRQAISLPKARAATGAGTATSRARTTLRPGARRCIIYSVTGTAAASPRTRRARRGRRARSRSPAPGRPNALGHVGHARGTAAPSSGRTQTCISTSYSRSSGLVGAPAVLGAGVPHRGGAAGNAIAGPTGPAHPAGARPGGPAGGGPGRVTAGTAAVLADADPAVLSELTVAEDLASHRLTLVPVADVNSRRSLRAIWSGGQIPPMGAARDLLTHVTRRQP